MPTVTTPDREIDQSGPAATTAHGPQPTSATELFEILRERMGWTDEFVDQTDDASYPPLRDLDEIVRALDWTRRNKKKIVVLPDFDMDGISSGVLGYAGLSELGFDVELYVPDYRRGHDISRDAIEELVARHPGVDVVITCDGGVNSHEGILRGRELGLVMLVTDHHVQLPTASDGSVTPSAHVTIDPERIDETYPHPGICGAFVLYQVLEAYTAQHQPKKRSSISMLKLFAGLGTVSDVMPLLFENRQLVRDSLSLSRLLLHHLPSADTATPYDVDQSILLGLMNARLAAGSHAPAYVRAFRGFAFVLQSWREAGSLRSSTDLKADFYGFYLAPAFNALRRIGAPMQTAFDVFTAPDPDLQLESARQIIEWNNLRKEMAAEWLEEIQTRDQPMAPHIWLTDAPAGMLGLLAGKLAEEHSIPVVVIHDPQNPHRQHGGSARAPGWFPIITVLTGRGYTAIGHEQACGVRARSLQELAAIAQLLEQESAVRLAELALALSGPDAAPEYDLALGIEAPGHTAPDGPVTNPEELLEIASRIDSFAPFGKDFPRPRVRLIVNLTECRIGVLGQEETHLKILLPSGMKLLWWNSAELLMDLMERVASPIPTEAIVEFDTDLSVNQFMGNESPQAIIKRIILPEDD